MIRLPSRLFFLAACLLAALVPNQTCAQAQASKQGGYIHYNNSRRVHYFSWASLTFTVNNNRSKDADLRIKMTPMNQRNYTIYDNTFTLGPGLWYDFHTLVTIGTVDRYAVDMYWDDLLVTDQNVRENILRLAKPEDQFIVFINDDRDLSYGMFSKNTNLDAPYVNSFNQAKKAPAQFAGYDNAYIVVLYRPDFSMMTSRQYNAILDYVARGGAVLFGDPQGIMEAWATPLRKFLPVTPLRIRKVEFLRSLTAIGGKPAFWPEGADFLESLPRGEGITTLIHEDFPLARWGRYGLGKVGVFAINPSQVKFQREYKGTNFDACWRHILSFGSRASYVSSTRDPSLTKAVDKLTGLKIPRAEFIRNFILIYLLIIILFVAAGFVFHQQLKSWIALCVISLLTTQGIFLYARYRARNLNAKTATILEFANYGTEDASTEQLISLILKKEQDLDLINSDVDLKLRSMPPPLRARVKSRGYLRRTMPIRTSKSRKAEKSKTPGKAKKKKKPKMFADPLHGKGEVMRQPLKICQRDGRSSLMNLKLRASKPQFFSTLHVRRGKVIEELPQVRWQADGPVIEPWPLPPELQAAYAVLVCEVGYFPLRLHNGRLSLHPSQGEGLQQPAVEYVALSKYLARGNVSAPMIALFQRTKQDSSGFLPQDFEVLGRRMQFVPVVEDLTVAGDIHVPFARIRVEARRDEARILKQQGEWVKVSPVHGKATRKFQLDCFLPPAHNALQVKQLKVNFVPENRGRNIEFRLFLKRSGEGNNLTTKNTGATEGLELKKQADGLYAIGSARPEFFAGVFGPANGHFVLVLTATPKEALKTDQLAKIRLNTWRVVRLQVAASGELPPARRGKL